MTTHENKTLQGIEIEDHRVCYFDEEGQRLPISPEGPIVSNEMHQELISLQEDENAGLDSYIDGLVQAIRLISSQTPEGEPVDQMRVINTLTSIIETFKMMRT